MTTSDKLPGSEFIRCSLTYNLAKENEDGWTMRHLRGSRARKRRRPKVTQWTGHMLEQDMSLVHLRGINTLD